MLCVYVCDGLARVCVCVCDGLARVNGLSCAPGMVSGMHTRLFFFWRAHSGDDVLFWTYHPASVTENHGVVDGGFRCTRCRSP